MVNASVRQVTCAPTARALRQSMTYRSRDREQGAPSRRSRAQRGPARGAAGARKPPRLLPRRAQPRRAADRRPIRAHDKMGAPPAELPPSGEKRRARRPATARAGADRRGAAERQHLLALGEAAVGPELPWQPRRRPARSCSVPAEPTAIDGFGRRGGFRGGGDRASRISSCRPCGRASRHTRLWSRSRTAGWPLRGRAMIERHGRCASSTRRAPAERRDRSARRSEGRNGPLRILIGEGPRAISSRPARAMSRQGGGCGRDEHTGERRRRPSALAHSCLTA